MSKDSSKKHFEARAIIEAVLLTATDPVSSGRLVALLSDYSFVNRDIRNFIEELNDEYSKGNRSFHIIELGGGFQIATREKFGTWLRKFHNNPNQIRLSQAGLESLAIVAFKQPITRIEIDAIRGVNSGGVMQTLMELKLIRIVGRSEGVGKPMLLGTTRDFLMHFGLKSLIDLPKAKELEELLASGEDKAELRQHLTDRLADLEMQAQTNKKTGVNQLSPTGTEEFVRDDSISDKSLTAIEHSKKRTDSQFENTGEEEL